MRKIVVCGLPGSPKTVAGLEGWDHDERRMWEEPVEPSPANPSESVPITVPDGVTFIRVISADQMVDRMMLQRAAGLDMFAEAGGNGPASTG